MYCPNCGKQLPDNAIFCSACGSRIGIAAQAPHPSTHPIQAAQNAPGILPLWGFFTSRKVPLWALGFFLFNLLADRSEWAITYCALLICVPMFLWNQLSIFLSIQQLKSRNELAAALTDFTLAQPLLKGKVKMGQTYLFARGKGRLYRYDEIYWLYRFRYSYMIIPIISAIRIGTTSGKVTYLCDTSFFNKQPFQELAKALYPKNPSITFGYISGMEKEMRKMAKEVKKAKH